MQAVEQVRASSNRAFALKAKNWFDCAHCFFKLCAESGNAEACYTLDMNRSSGASLMSKVAIASHAEALHSLAVIQFNDSGGSKIDKDLRAGVALSARAAFLGHVDALRELSHCLQDGYSVHHDFIDGLRFLLQADARELVSPSEAHPARRFMREWLSERRRGKRDVLARGVWEAGDSPVCVGR